MLFSWNWREIFEYFLPSGPIAWTSCRILETIAKYCGKSVVRILVILLVFKSSSWFISSASKESWRTSWTASSVASSVCSFQVSPLSDLRITISRSLPRRLAKWGTSMITGLEYETSTEKENNYFLFPFENNVYKKRGLIQVTVAAARSWTHTRQRHFSGSCKKLRHFPLKF